MKTVLLAAGALALTLSAGQALANTHHKHHKGATASVAEPKQPIPYAQLDAYLKASPAQKAKKDWWAGQPALASNSSAATAGANASATTAPSASTTTTPSPSPSPSPSDTTTLGSSTVNPAPSSTSAPPSDKTSPPSSTSEPPPK